MTDKEIIEHQSLQIQILAAVIKGCYQLAQENNDMDIVEYIEEFNREANEGV